jgi:uncharacterized damage-inducible protein DinB
MREAGLSLLRSPPPAKVEDRQSKEKGVMAMTADLTTLTRNALIEELQKLRDEVRNLAEPLSELRFWTKPLEPGNSVGHLVLHLSGNLQHFVGAQLGGTGYVRDREREFSETKVPSKAEALKGLDEAIVVFRKVVSGLSAEQLASPHPETRFGSVLNALTHLVTHFALHRGQMSYIIRLLPRDAFTESVGREG